MTARPCASFRRDFEPGRRDPHLAACESCRRWALEVESWRDLGARAPLPETLRARLVTLASEGPAAPPAPRLPLPPPLRARLLRIPAAARARHRVLKARYAVAASYLLAGLLTLAAGGAGEVERASAARGVAQVRVRGSEVLRDVNGWILAGCGRANRTLEKLLCHLGGARGPAGERTPSDPEQEDTDGTRPAP